MYKINSVKRHTLSRSVAEEILKLINSVYYKVGDKLPSERELMEKLQVGRSCLREAMQGLGMLNIVSIQPGRGTFIKTTDISNYYASGFEIKLSKEVLKELFEVRFILEVEAAGLAAKRITISDIQDFKRLLSKLEKSEGDSIRQVSLQIHHMMARITKNRILIKTLDSLYDILDKYQIAVYSNNLSKIEVAIHRKLINDVISGDPEKAKATMKEHLEFSYNAMKIE